MAGQYGDPNNGAGETIPNYHEGWGRIDLGSSINSSFVDGETVSTDSLENSHLMFQHRYLH